MFILGPAYTAQGVLVVLPVRTGWCPYGLSQGRVEVGEWEADLDGETESGGGSEEPRGLQATEDGMCSMPSSVPHAPLGLTREACLAKRLKPFLWSHQRPPWESGSEQGLTYSIIFSSQHRLFPRNLQESLHRWNNLPWP